MSETNESVAFDPSPGTHIENATKEALALAMAVDRPVSFTFNGVAVLATPNDSAPAILKRWRDDMDASAKAYRESPAGKAEVARTERAKSGHQGRVNKLLSSLDSIVSDGDALMDWIAMYAVSADYFGVDASLDRVRQAIESAGYKRNAHVGRKPAFFNNRKVMREYVAGQVLECLAVGMGPHPIVTKFVDEYRALPLP